MLVDTHVVLELLLAGGRLGPRAYDAVAGEQVFVSTVSVWEIAIKRRLGKLPVPSGWETAVQESGFRSLPMLAEHASAIGEVEGLKHEDPFDRLLLSQARIEGLDFWTGDRAILAAGLPYVRDARS